MGFFGVGGLGGGGGGGVGNNNTYIFYSSIPRWASSVCLLTYMYIIYTIYID